VTVDPVDLLRRLLTEVVVVNERYGVLCDSDGYRQLVVTDEEMAYCRALSGEEPDE
jgi:hypothetical protein